MSLSLAGARSRFPGCAGMTGRRRVVSGCRFRGDDGVADPARPDGGSGAGRGSGRRGWLPGRWRVLGRGRWRVRRKAAGAQVRELARRRGAGGLCRRRAGLPGVVQRPDRVGSLRVRPGGRCGAGRDAAGAGVMGAPELTAWQGFPSDAAEVRRGSAAGAAPFAREALPAGRGRRPGGSARQLRREAGREVPPAGCRTGTRAGGSARRLRGGTGRDRGPRRGDQFGQVAVSPRVRRMRAVALPSLVQTIRS